MATPTNHWKLGLFVLLGAVVTLTTVGVLGVRSLRKETGSYVSYFDESVEGLEVGSPIKFRGVTIGTVGTIDVAPDHRHVEVTSEIRMAALSRLGLDVAGGLLKRGAPKKLVQAIDLRVQLASSGLTGVKFLELDFFTVVDNPRPSLPFPVPKNYIPATSSTMKYLQASVVRTMNSLPQIRVPRRVARVQVVARLHDERIVRWEETVTVDRPVVATSNGDTADAAVKAMGRALRATVDRIADRVVHELAGAPVISPAVTPAAQAAPPETTHREPPSM